MKPRSTAATQLRHSKEKEQQESNAKRNLALAKVQEAQKKGKYVWNKEQRAFFLTS